MIQSLVDDGLITYPWKYSENDLFEITFSVSPFVRLFIVFQVIE